MSFFMRSTSFYISSLRAEQFEKRIAFKYML